MAEHVVAAVLQRAGAAVIQEAASLRQVPAKVETLKSELRRMQCFLRDTDARMERGEMANLVSEVRDVAYSIEIIIDMANILARENNIQWSFMGAISKGAHYPFHCMHLYSIVKRIDRVTARVHAIFQEYTKYKIVGISLNEMRYSMDENASLRAKRLILPDFEDEVDVIGFHTEINQIKDDLLDSENKDLTVISLVGPGGAGKSTVARKVYNLVAKKHFNSCAWICISQQFTVYGALKDIVKGTMGTQNSEELGKMSEAEIIKKINNFLKDKTYLVVLDDVWRMEDWDMIQAAFPDVKNGSRMVVTTRNSAVSNHPNTRKITQELNLLNDEESIELFNRKAFPPYVVHDRNDMDSLREIGKALALKCNGLPLAIVVLGGFLSKNLRITEWRRMVASINWDAMKNEGDIKAILDLSYYDLSSNLKACFLYITSFPEDYAVPVGLLTKLWIAEGFIPNVRECSLEETALRYVEELAQRCMVLTEKRSSRCIKTVKVHDVLRDWGTGRARREGFFKDCSSSNDVETSYSNEMRAYRVVLYDSVCVKVGVSIPNLHSLLILNAARLDRNVAFSFHGLYYLRVLYFDGMRGKWQIPTEIGKMVHLRYLGLKGGTYVLPASISNLTNLHTFDARDATVEALPIALLSIWTLKHVHIYKVESWSMLKTTIQSNLKSLFILLASNMPKQWEAAIDRMESNPSWCFGKHYQSVKQLEIVGSFEDKFGVPNDLHLPDLLLLPHNLRRLKFSCPNLLNDEDPMPTLGSWLPFLNVLEIGFRSYTGATITCSSGWFPNLYNLVLHDLDVEEWVLEDGAMPKLRILTLCKCTKLKALPEGLQHLKELRKLKVIAMPKLCQVLCYLLHRAGREVIIRSSEEDFQHVEIP
uniref:Nucleotide binding site/leucine rich repeat (NBS/LRR) kinase n=1 Tax=Brachypodium sylvaticum TaxID=29664 RepID=Q2L3E2_BRASY|nr:nucleotide binding site/leucine rich repeat (NBS/LRR) kinase [Brachypodium sylvaticum]